MVAEMRQAHVAQPAVREAALRSLGGGGLTFWLIATPLSLLVALGVAAFAYQLKEGLGVTGLNDQVFWGIYTANFVTFIGISYGGAVISAVLRLSGASWRAPITRLAEAMAVVSLAVGGLFVIIHLGQPLRVWNMVVHAQISSPLFWDMVAISTYLVGTIVFLYLPLIPDIAVCRDRVDQSGLRHRLYAFLALGWRGTSEQRRILTWGVTLMAVIIIPLAVAVHSVLAWAFAVTSRTGWHSTIFGPYFVVAALFSGVATVILVIAAFRKAYHLEAYIETKHFQYLGYMMMGLGVLYLYFTFSEFLTEGYVLDQEVQGLYESLLVTTYAPMFWAFVIGGMAIPIGLVALPRTRTINWIVFAAALAAIGMWLKRFLIVVPPLAGDSSYTPSWVEIAVTVGALAAIPLFLMIFVRIFPVLSIWEMEEESMVEEPEKRAESVPEFAVAQEVV